MSLKDPQEGGGGNDAAPGILDLGYSFHALQVLRQHYTMIGKADWWWIFDDTLKEVARQLLTQDFAVLDGFVPSDLNANIKGELQAMHATGAMERGLLAGGRTGKNLKYALGSVRGDYVVWVDGQQANQKNLHTYLQRVDTCVSELANFLPELKSITNRSEAMLTCYPGGGARYTRHCDNPNQNGRKLTALLYLNESWKDGDGGQLRVCHPPPFESHAKAELSPIGGRLVLFWSDKRVPHEVLPSHAHRYTVTVWYFDGAEKARADDFAKKAAAAKEAAERVACVGSAGSEHNDFAQEDERIRNEIKKFEEQQAATGATPIVGDVTALVIDEPELIALSDADVDTAGSEHNQLSLDSDDELPEGAYLEFAPAQRSELVSERAQTVPNTHALVPHADDNATATAEAFFDRTMQASATMQAQLDDHRKQQSEMREEFGEERINAWRQEHENFLDGTSATSRWSTRAGAKIHSNPAGTSGNAPGIASPEELQAATPTVADAHNAHENVAHAPDVQDQLDELINVPDARARDETDLFELD